MNDADPDLENWKARASKNVLVASMFQAGPISERNFSNIDNIYSIYLIPTEVLTELRKGQAEEETEEDMFYLDDTRRVEDLTSERARLDWITEHLLYFLDQFKSRWNNLAHLRSYADVVQNLDNGGYPKGIAFTWNLPQKRKKVKLPLDSYITKMLAWIEREVGNKKNFPEDLFHKYSDRIESIMKKCWTRLYRLFCLGMSNGMFGYHASKLEPIKYTDPDNFTNKFTRAFLYCTLFVWTWELVKPSEWMYCGFLLEKFYHRFLTDQLRTCNSLAHHYMIHNGFEYEDKYPESIFDLEEYDVDEKVHSDLEKTRKYFRTQYPEEMERADREKGLERSSRLSGDSSGKSTRGSRRSRAKRTFGGGSRFL